MMKSKLSVALCIVSGSFFLYCGESTVNKMISGNEKADASFVNDAKAQNSCNSACAAPSFTKLWEGDLTPTSKSTPNLQVGNFREYIVYSQGTEVGDFCVMSSDFRLDANTPYVRADVLGDDVPRAQRGQVQGPDMMLTGGIELSSGACAGEWKYHIVVAGIL